MAEYTNVTVKFKVESGDPVPYFYTTLHASVFLVVGAPGKPDWIALTIPFHFALYDYDLTIAAKVRMPAGTITTTAIGPFSAPVSLTAGDGAVTYACPACAPPYTGNSTSLAFASGTLSATEE
jgi:hypothetical protein